MKKINHDSLTQHEVLAAFSNECCQLLPGSIKRLEEELTELNDYIKAIKATSLDSWQKDFYCMAAVRILGVGDKIELLERFRTMYKLAKKPLSQNNISDKIAKAKQVPILELHNFERVRRLTGKTQACCPFHEDKTPSFFVYHNTNSFHCFSCQQGGSSIDFYMKLTNSDFKTAVNKMV